ncbi:hypothetical protein JCM10296v2_003238 [Rhodotorula toruloides]
MLTRVPLDVVHLVIRHAIDRDAYDEDRPAYQQRLAHLCLICRVFRDAVQPELWKTFRSRTLKRFDEVAGRDGADQHLLEHIEDFRGGPALSEEDESGAAALLLDRLPRLRSITLSLFGLGTMAFEASAPFDNLRSLSLQYYHLDAISTNFTLPHLETLALNEVFASTATFRNILHPNSTPRLRRLSLVDIRLSDFTLFRRSRCPPLDVSRLQVAHFAACLRARKLLSSLQFDPATLVSFGWSVGTPAMDLPLGAVHRQPNFLHLDKLPHSFFDRNDSAGYVFVSKQIELFRGALERVKAVFVPSDFANPTLLDERTKREAFFTLIVACRKYSIPVVLYEGRRDAPVDFPTASLRHIERMDDLVYNQHVPAQTAKLVQEWEEYDAEMAHLPTTPSSSQ